MVDETVVQHVSFAIGVADDSFAQYHVTPTSSIADNVNVTDVVVVDVPPLSIDTDGLDGVVESEIVKVIESLADADTFPAESLNHTYTVFVLSPTLPLLNVNDTVAE